MPYDKDTIMPLTEAEREDLAAIQQRDDRIAALEAQVAVLDCELERLRDNERRMRAVLEQYHRVESDRARLQMRRYHPGLGGAGQCECTMDRQSLIDAVIRAVHDRYGQDDQDD
jgi:multidrug resistance efflux pump